jgi:hypothetical protein
MNRRILFISVILLFFVISCEETKQNPPVQSLPEIEFFTVNSSTTYKGDTVTLSWSVKGSDTVSIDHNIGVVAAAGSQTVMIDNYGEVTYRLTASNSAGNSTAVVSIKVNVLIAKLWENRYEYNDGTGLSGPLIEDMIMFSNGGFALIGSVYSMLSGASDPILLIFDKQGKVLREYLYNSNNQNFGLSIVETPDYGFFITGSRLYTLDEEDKYAFHLFKTDGRGRVLWQRDLYDNRESANDCVVSDDGNYIITGSAYNTSENTVVSQVYLGKFKEEKPIWEKTFTRNEFLNASAEGHKILKTSDGGYIILGLCYERTEPNWKHYIYLIKTDNEGNLIWDKIIGESSGKEIIQTKDGGFAIVGTSFVEDSESAYVVKTDSTGNIEWEKRFGNQGDEKLSVNSIISCSDGNFLIIGDHIANYDSINEVYIAKINSSGGLIWKTDYSPDQYKKRFGMWAVETGIDEYIILAQEQSWPLTHYTSNIWLFKIKIEK